MIDKNSIKGVIFDYGGTIDTGGDHWSEVIWKAYNEAGVPVGKPVFREAYVYAERELARTRHILPEHDFMDLMNIKIRIEFEWLLEHAHISLDTFNSKSREVAILCYGYARNKIEEVRPVLCQLCRNYPLVLVSNFYGNVECVLKDFGLFEFFPKIIESAVVGIRKPDPKIFELGVEALGIRPEETLVIGDSYRKDIVPAEKLGCHAVWIKGKGWTDEEDEQTHPLIINSLNELLNLLDMRRN